VKNDSQIAGTRRPRPTTLISLTDTLSAVALIFLILTFASSASAGVFLKLGDILVIDPSGGPNGVSRLQLVDTTTSPPTQTIIAEGGFLDESVGVAFAADGNILVLDRVNGLIRVNPATLEQTVVSSGQHFRDPFALTIGRDGYVYIADSGFRANGPGPYVNVAGKIIRIIPGPSNNNQQIIASGRKDGTCPATDISDPSANTTACVNTSTAGHYLNHPYGIGVDAGNGMLLVSDMSSFNGKGAILRINPALIPVDVDGHQVTAHQDLPQDLIWGPAGESSGQPLVVQTTPGSYGCPMGLSVEQNGNILASYACSGSGIIRVNLASNTQQALSSSAGCCPSPLSGSTFGWKMPFGIDTETNTNVIAVDALSGNLYRLKATPGVGLYGEFLDPFRAVSIAAASGQVARPTGVAVIKKEPSVVFKSAKKFAFALENGVTTPTFRLRISDGTGLGIVVTDTTDFSGGDSDNRAGYISFAGFIGNFHGGITLAWSERENQAGETLLTLQSRMARFAVCDSASPCTAADSRLVISVEDGDYSFPDVTATLTGTLLVENVTNGTGSFQTWINRSNQSPSYGNNTYPAGPLNPVELTIPDGSAALFVQPGVNDVSGVNQPMHVETGRFIVANPYALFSRAVLDYSTATGGGFAHFTVEAKVGPDRGGRPLFPDDVPAAPVVTSVTGPLVPQVVGAAVSITGLFTDVQLGDNHTCTLNWGDGVTTSGTITEDTATTPGSCVGSHSYTLPGTYSVLVTVSDAGLSGSAPSAPFTVYEPNTAPAVNSVTGPVIPQALGAAVSISGLFTDAQLGDNHTCTLNWGDGATTPGTITEDTAATPGSCVGSHSYTVPGTYSVLVTVSDGSLSSSASSAPFAVYVPNTAPVITSVTGPVIPQVLGTSISIKGLFTDAQLGDNHTCTLDWGNGVITPGTITEDTATAPGSCTGSHSYTLPGTYSVLVTVNDGGLSDATASTPFAVFDPEASIKATGEIISPVGAYKPQPQLGGTLRFAFVAKYRNNDLIPDGNTLIHYKAAKFRFKSSSYKSLLITTPNKATFTGSGTVRIHALKHAADDDCDLENHYTDAKGAYDFRIIAQDGGTTGNAGDTIRIKIWLRNSADPADESATIYDSDQDSPLTKGKITVK
jgi:hypothetical protein